MKVIFFTYLFHMIFILNNANGVKMGGFVHALK